MTAAVYYGLQWESGTFIHWQQLISHSDIVQYPEKAFSNN